MIEWQDFYSGAELAAVYQRSKLASFHFSGGSARHPLTCAMVNATPVIASRAVDIPEYLGELGIYIDGSAASIVDAVTQVESGQHDLPVLGQRLRAKGLAELDYQKIAQSLSQEYLLISRSEASTQIQPPAVD
jgi:glycosyltransferase involved in cell wall biosynthesis